MEEWTSVEADWLPPPTAMEGVMTADDGEDTDIARGRVVWSTKCKEGSE